jgi:hypothetical protein
MYAHVAVLLALLPVLTNAAVDRQEAAAASSGGNLSLDR